MSFGKSGGTTYQAAELTPEQRADIAARTNLLTGTIAPAYQQGVEGAQAVYKGLSPNVNQAAQNLQGAAGSAQAALGSTGESALRTGLSGLENLFSNNYEQQQLQAALAPAEAQYQQNLSQLQAGFGGTGNLGSARQALAERQLAGQTQAAQQQTLAQVANQVAQQRASAATTLAQLGQGGIGQALGAAGQQVTAAMTPQQLYNQYASVIFGTPAASYTPDYRGTQGTTVNKTSYDMGIGGSAGSSPFKIGF